MLPSQTLCIITTVCTRREDSAKLPSGDTVVCGKAINCVPRGNNGSRLTSHRGRKKTTHPGKDCAPRQRGSFRHHLRCHADLWYEVCSQGEWKWCFWVPGECDILSGRCMSFSDHKTTAWVIGSSQVWLDLGVGTPHWDFLFLND